MKGFHGCSDAMGINHVWKEARAVLKIDGRHDERYSAVKQKSTDGKAVGVHLRG